MGSNLMGYGSYECDIDAGSNDWVTVYNLASLAPKISILFIVIL